MNAAPEQIAIELRNVADIVIKHKLCVLGIQYSRLRTSGRNAWQIHVDELPEDLYALQCTTLSRHCRDYDALRTSVGDVEIIALIERTTPCTE